MMKSSHPKLLDSLILVPCFLMLALAGCQSYKARHGALGSGYISSMSQHNGKEAKNHLYYNPTFQAANFVSIIDNPYLALTPGKTWIYAGKDNQGNKIKVEVQVTPDEKSILGIVATVVRERVWQNGELVNEAFEWYAQDRDGNVWYFGTESKEIDNGQIASSDDSWEAGVNGAEPGIVMKAHARVGDAYRQEFLKGEAEEMGQVISKSQTIKIASGEYKNCLQVQNWTGLEPGIAEYKFYSQKVGNVILAKKIAGERGQLSLVEMKTEKLAQSPNM